VPYHLNGRGHPLYNGGIIMFTLLKMQVDLAGGVVGVGGNGEQGKSAMPLEE